MKKILLSITSIIFAGALVLGGTMATYNSQNTSSGNTFATGIIDLKIDNESYVTDNDGKLVFSSSTSWSLAPLAGHLFFNFLDLKPGDIGEDTISLHVNNNNAWVCMNINLTATPENGQPEPEVVVDPTTGINDGELQNNLYFSFWADDGDNVYEKGEKVFKQGLVKDIWNGKNWSVADSQTNIWGGAGPMLANTTKYIGKAWCFGTLTENAVNQDSQGKTGSNGPLVRGTGFTCQGKDVGNIVQSDGIKADVSFLVVQSRSNSEFVCEDNGEGDPGDEYCSHGYWKQSQHFGDWHNYTPNQLFSSVFENAFPGKTLLQVLQLGGGGLNQLGRETVGALLNAGSVDFPYTQAQVIAMFNSAYPGSANDYTVLTSKFAIPENCPLGGGNITISTLFSDNFNSCSKGKEFNKIDNGKWDQVGGVQGDDHGNPHGKVAALDAGTNQSGANHIEVLTTESISTSGYNNIVLKYDHNMDVPGGTTATLTVAYSVNGGSSWTTLDTYTTDHDWVTKTSSLSPSADNKGNIKIRFTLVGTNANDVAYIDNISITGTSI